MTTSNQMAFGYQLCITHEVIHGEFDAIKWLNLIRADTATLPVS
jgi:hypothetical protein